MTKPIMRTLPAIAVATLLAPSLASAALLYTTPGSVYTETFDRDAGAATTFPWTNDSSIPNWFAYQTGTSGPPAQYRATNGLSSGIVLYLFRTGASATDHAFGTKPLDASGSVVMGLAVQNNTGLPLESFTLGYTGEQWVDHNTANQNLTVAYQTFSTAPGDTSLGSGTWTNIPSLQFDSLKETVSSGGTSVNLDGNDPTNRTVFAPVTVTLPTPLPAGEFLMVRWFDTNSTGTDHGLAIDDVSFSATAIPEPTSLLAACGLALPLITRRRTRN